MKVLFSCTYRKFATHWTFLTWRWRRWWCICIKTPNFQHHSHPKTLSIYHQKALVFWQFWEITQSPLYFGEIENISHLLQIKVTLYRNVATNIWTNLHALTQRPLLFACSLSLNTQGSWVPAIPYNQLDQYHVYTGCPQKVGTNQWIMHFSLLK